MFIPHGKERLCMLRKDDGTWSNHALQRTCGASWLKSLRPACRVAELGSLGKSKESVHLSYQSMKKLLLLLGFLIAACSTRGSGLDSLVHEGHELHASLKTRQMDDSVRHVPRALIPGNPHVSTNAAFIAAIARSGSQGSLGREGIRSALYALYREKRELGFYGLEAVSAADADRREDALRKIWAHNVRLGIAQVHRKGLVLVVVWTDGVSPECWEAVNASVVERLTAH
jgi:hypothetical protein